MFHLTRVGVFLISYNEFIKLIRTSWHRGIKAYFKTRNEQIMLSVRIWFRCRVKYPYNKTKYLSQLLLKFLCKQATLAKN